MQIRKEIKIQDIQKAITGNGWAFGNEILYEMCRKNPKHKNSDVVVGKVWLIGRSYAAAIERRKNASEINSGDDFYFNVVAPKFLQIGEELDNRIDDLKKCDSITKDNLNIARRKKEDKLNEFDIDARAQNMKICVDYVFEYFNNYLNITEAEEKTVLHNEKLEKYRKQLMEYDPEVREWVVGNYNEYGKQIHKYIGNILKENEFFFLYNTESEFRNASYDCYSQLIKRLPFLKDQTEMLFLFIKDYHRVESEQRFNFGIPSITEEITDWIDKTWPKYQVNLLAFAYSWINSFYDNEDVWPSSHRKKSQ